MDPGKTSGEAAGPSLSEVLNGVPEGILVVDKTGRIVAVNESLSRMLGISRDALQGASCKVITGRQGDPEPEIPLLATLKTGREFHASYPGKRLAVCTLPLRDAGGGITGAMAVLRDLSYQQELEQAVIKAERLAILGQLCAITMHEIKNPLAAVRGYLQLFQQELQDSPRVGRIKTMLAAVDRINAIITDFLRLARPALPQRKPCSLRETVAAALKLMQAELERRNIRVTFRCQEWLPPALLDAEQFHQVLLNVFNNSCEAMAGGGELSVQITADPAAGCFRIGVTDTGPGLEEGVRARVFDPFFTTKENGTGLGLYVSRLIVKNHGGDMKIENNPGKGCKVVILLPFPA